jgi:hypothetical protein
LVPDKKQTVCKCPEGTELKNGKCVEKRSVLENILGHVTIGVGVGVGGGGRSGVQQENPHDPVRGTGH